MMQTRQIVTIGPEGVLEEKANLAEEKPLTIYWNDQELVTILCTPAHLDELAVGFLYSSGILQGLDDVTRVDVDAGRGIAWVSGQHNADLNAAFHRYLGSGCGGEIGFYTLAGAMLAPQVTGGPRVSAAALWNWMRQVQERSRLYLATRGVHGAALAAPEAGIKLFREDIGRHNAVDKLAGALYLQGATGEGLVLLTTGRISSEVLTKAARSRITVVVSRSVPTTLACSYADQLGITLVGRVRGQRLNVYTYPRRILEAGC